MILFNLTHNGWAHVHAIHALGSMHVCRRVCVRACVRVFCVRVFFVFVSLYVHLSLDMGWPGLLIREAVSV